MGIFKEQVLEERARHAEAQAMNLAERADSMTARLAEALTRLRAYEPEYVAGQLGEEIQPPARARELGESVFIELEASEEEKD